MPRKPKRPWMCHCESTATCHYDVPNDEFFVECDTCNEQGLRTPTEKSAKRAWADQMKERQNAQATDRRRGNVCVELDPGVVESDPDVPEV